MRRETGPYLRLSASICGSLGGSFGVTPSAGDFKPQMNADERGYTALQEPDHRKNRIAYRVVPVLAGAAGAPYAVSSTPKVTEIGRIVQPLLLLL